ncbi:MAG: hypothetical protein Kow0010_06260 [Dehalococcoidia bacterium]
MLVGQPGGIGPIGRRAAPPASLATAAAPMPLAMPREAFASGAAGSLAREVDEAIAYSSQVPPGWPGSPAAGPAWRGALPLARSVARETVEPPAAGSAPSGTPQAIGRVISVDQQQMATQTEASGGEGGEAEKIDYEKLADHVWRRIKRRIQLERERERGFA